MKKINWPDQILNFIGVIVGVSLAFLINNYAEKSKQKSEYQNVVQSFIQELDFEINIFENGQIPANRKQLAKIDSLFSKYGNEEKVIFPHKSFLFGYQNYYPQNVTYNSIKNSGKLDLIDDFELRKSIIIYHEIVGKEAKFKGEEQIKFYNEQITPFLLEEMDLKNPKESQITTLRMNNLLFIYGNIIRNKISHYEKVVKEAKSLRAKIAPN